MTLATMLSRGLLGLAFLFLFAFAPAQAQWINELHYDNLETDVDEAVEVVLPASANPADFDVYLYNGANGEVYGASPYNIGTDFTEGDTEGGFTFYSITLPTNGLQNGSPDGLALVENGALVPGQFLSYEGTFDGIEGPANGVTSTDIGVEQTNSTPIGESLQLTGTGTEYADFTWTGPVADSFGSLNDGQAFEVSDTPVVFLTAATAEAPEGATVDVTVEIDYPDDTPDGNPVEVSLDFLPGESSADAADFDGPTPATVTFSGTEDNEQLTFSLDLTADDGAEGPEEAVFELAVTSGTADLGEPSEFTLTIADGDSAPPARVQIIHNLADPVADTVDVYVTPAVRSGGGLVLEDVAFRSATAFLDVLPGSYEVTVTADGDPGFVFIEEIVTVESEETYQLIAAGVTDPTAFEANPDGEDIEATLFVNPDALEANINDFEVAVNAVHGATDAPTVDVRDADTDVILVDDATYGDITDYLSIAPQAYTLDVTTADGSVVVGTFVADLEGLEGGAATVLASGFLTPGNDQDGPALGLLAVLPDGTSFLLPQRFDVTIDGARNLPLGSFVQVEGVVTRARGAFTYMQDETAGLTIRQTSGTFFEAVEDGSIAPGTELRVSGLTSEFNGLFQINDDDLEDFEILGETDVPAPQTVTLDALIADGEDYEAELVEVTDLVIDGSGTFTAATSYDVTDPTAELAAGFRIPNADDTALDGEPIPDGLVTFTGVVGQFSFDDPDAGYQLMGIETTDIEEQEIETALLQVIHNAPDPAFETVDVYIDGNLGLDDFAFRTATEFGQVPAGVEIEVAVAPSDSEGVEDAIFTETYTLDVAGTYQLIATGVGDPGDFAENPDGISTAFTLLVNPDAQQTSTGGAAFVDVNAVHGTPDAPTVDIVEATSGAVLVDDIAYTDITGYTAIPVGSYFLDVTLADDNDAVLASFEADLSDFGGDAVTVLASGFLEPSANQDGPSFGVLVVTADGVTEFLEPLSTSTEDGASLPTTFALDGNYPNPLTTTTTLRYDLPADAQVSLAIYDVLGREVLRVEAEAVAAGAGRTIALDAAALPSGAYLYRVTAEMPSETISRTGRMTVVR